MKGEGGSVLGTITFLIKLTLNVLENFITFQKSFNAYTHCFYKKWENPMQQSNNIRVDH